MKKKILIVIPTLEIGGGAEKNAVLLARAFSLKHEVKLANFYQIKNEYEVSQFRYVLGETPGKSMASKGYFFMRRVSFINKICRTYKPDIILSFSFHSNLVVSIVSLLSIRYSHRVILSIRTNLFGISRLHQFICRILYNI